ncbi:RNA polymerase II, fourth largest subunit [Trachipleistophora hominis]|uniref:RNA polymerase II, fourth largest subunit n=1 Tax=Trachipleistophora hominis TaxID=72359 RepID=L7JXP8_TRAHO|nr:RNA polymerase II, fourth largest subunit [Trachipleistophora hominis]
MVQNTSHPLTISEAFHHLASQRPRIIKKDVKFRTIFENTYNYCQQHTRVSSTSLMENLRTSLIELGLNEDEVAIVASLFPQSVDEVRLLVDSLGRLDEQTLIKVINKINSVS